MKHSGLICRHVCILISLQYHYKIILSFGKMAEITRAHATAALEVLEIANV